MKTTLLYSNFRLTKCCFIIRGVCILNRENLVGHSNSESTSESLFDLTKQRGFDYQNLDRQTQISVKQKTFEIKSLIRQTAQDIFHVGQKLAEVKQQLKHGEFRNWLNTEFNWSISSATKFMQVSEQFKNVNFTHLNFATSALYVLAAPSAPENARQHALQLASRGEHITYSLAKQIVKHHKESAASDAYLSESFLTSESAENDPSNSQRLSDAREPSDTSPKEFLTLKGTPSDKDIASHHTEPVTVGQQIDIDGKAIEERNDDRSVRIVKIKQEPKPIEDRIQDFEIMYAGVRIAVEGSPQDLTRLFEKMQNNPQFAEDIFRQAKSQSQ